MVRQLTPGQKRRGDPIVSTRWARAGAFTLVELVILSSVLVLLTSLSYVSFLPFLQERRLRQAAIELQTQLLRARAVAQKSQSSCQITQTDSATVSFGGASGFSGNACTSTTLPIVSLSSSTDVLGLAVVTGTATTFTFTGNGSLAGSTDAVTILSANNTSTQWCVKATAPAGLIVVGSRLSSTDTCNYVRD
jgi:Tfp pilus assembly protein FimT